MVSSGTSSANSYAPSFIVSSTHNILHLNGNLQKVDNTFNMSYYQLWNDYTKSLLPVPCILAGLGIIALILLNIALIGRIACGICKCAPGQRYRKDGRRDSKVWINSILFELGNLTKGFYFFAFLAVVTDQALYVGNQYLTQGVNDGVSELNTLSTKFSSLITASNTLQTAGTVLSKYAETCGDKYLYSSSSAMTQYQAKVSTFSSYVSPIPSIFYNIATILANYGQTTKDDSVWIIYAAVLAIVFLYEFGICYQNKRLLQVLIGLSQILLIVLIAICLVDMVLLMGLSDYCMNPSTNTVKLLNPNSIYYSTLQYFTTCAGNNPLEPSVNNITASVKYFSGKVSYCNNTNIRTSMENEITLMYSNIQSINNITNCANIQNLLNEFTQGALCSNTFLGLFIIWSSQYLTAASIFIVTVCSAIIFQLFGRYWDFSSPEPEDNPEDEYADEADEEENIHNLHSYKNTYKQTENVYGVNMHTDKLRASTAAGNEDDTDDDEQYNYTARVGGHGHGHSRSMRSTAAPMRGGVPFYFNQQDHSYL